MEYLQDAITIGGKPLAEALIEQKEGQTQRESRTASEPEPELESLPEPQASHEDPAEPQVGLHLLILFQSL